MSFLEACVAVLCGGLVSSILTYLTARRKQTISSDEKVRETILEILKEEREATDTCEKKVIFLTEKVEALLVENVELKQKVIALTDNVRELQKLILAHYAYSK